jgi:hypothetical protein
VPKRNLTLLVVALAGVSLIIGCGGGDESTPSSEPASSNSGGGTLSKAEFIKRGDAICKKGDAAQYDEARKYRAEHAKELASLSPTRAEEKLLRVVVLPLITRQAKELEALGVPKGDGKEVRALIAAIEAGVRKARKNPYGIELEFGYENPLREVAELAGDYGFGECRNLA